MTSTLGLIRTEMVPPMHSVTSLPVISRCTPPGWVPICHVVPELGQIMPLTRDCPNCEVATPDTYLVVHIEEGPQLLPDLLEGPGLEARFGFDGVAMHRVRHPHDETALLLDSTDERRQLLAELLGPYRVDKHDQE